MTLNNILKGFVLALIIVYSSGVMAQKKANTSIISTEQKVGVVNTDSVLMNLKEFPTQIKIMEAYQKQLAAELEVKTLEFETKLADYQNKEISEKTKQQLLTDLQQLEQQIQQLKQSAQQKIAEKERELLVPLNSKIFTAIDAVAKRLEFTHIADSKNFYFVSPSFDLTKMVIEEANKR